jgi:hypothetical protein
VSRLGLDYFNHVVAGFSPRSTRWKLTRAKARDYMITAAFWPNEEFFSTSI